MCRIRIEECIESARELGHRERTVDDTEKKAAARKARTIRCLEAMRLLKEWSNSHKRVSLMEELDKELACLEQERGDHTGRKKYMRYIVL